MKTLITHLFFILLIFNIQSLTANCLEDDYIALRAIYLNTDGDNWTDNTGWPDEVFFLANPTLPAGTDISTWFGIIVDSNGCALELMLGTNNLNGTIPTEIEYLINLTHFNLHENQLTGIIPPEIGTLTNLTYLNLFTNQLTGIIPTTIGNLINLYHLNLKENQLTGSIPSEIGNLTALAFLFLHDNLLTGTLPAEIGSLNIVRVWVYNNQLSGCYDASLANHCLNTNYYISQGNNFDATWADFCDFGSGVCTACPPIVHVEVESADIYLDDACYGVILTSPSGLCYRLRVEDDGSFISELVTCP